ncbi:hypothetical protein JCM24511_08980 [Saitozyma sp. JCM 24511]|nr:hypothetical protein JCM24511_08980 [Saitozyma sp. JCM 24511]
MSSGPTSQPSPDPSTELQELPDSFDAESIWPSELVVPSAEVVVPGAFQLPPGSTSTSISPVSNQLPPNGRSEGAGPHVDFDVTTARTPQTYQSLDSVIGRDQAVYVLSLFFDFVYPLTPCLHQPTFLSDLARKKDESEPIFLALVLSVLASALVQIPRTLLPIFGEVSPLDMAGRCWRASRSISNGLYDAPSLELVTVRYLDGVYHSLCGNVGLQTASLGEAVYLGVWLGLHDESTYAGLDPITTEIRRRLFSLMFSSDKSIACLKDRPIFLNEEDCTAQRSLDIDDEYIAETAYLEQPAGLTPKISGFNFSTRLHEVIGQALVLQRSVRKQNQLSPQDLLSYLRRTSDLSQKLSDMTNELPPELRIEETRDGGETLLDNDGWGRNMLAQLETYLRNINSSPHTLSDNSFLVMKGNIHVTHALARFLLICCREEILKQSGPPGGAVRTAAERVISYSYGISDQREQVIVDLHRVLRQIPTQSLAVNGPSLVNKIRYVAVTLLDPPFSQEALSERVQGGHTYLMDFLQILSELDRNPTAS